MEKAIFPSSSSFGHWERVKGFFTGIDVQTISKRHHEMQGIILRVLSHASWDNTTVKNFFGADGLAAIHESVERAKEKHACAFCLQNRVEEDETSHPEGTGAQRLTQQALEMASRKVQAALAAEMNHFPQPRANSLAKAKDDQAFRKRMTQETEARERVTLEAEALVKARREAEAVERAALEAEAEVKKRLAMAKEEEAERVRMAEAEADRLSKAQAEQDNPAYTIRPYGTPSRLYSRRMEYPFKLESKDFSWSFRVVSLLLFLSLTYLSCPCMRR
jgi:hypothetical protein